MDKVNSLILYIAFFTLILYSCDIQEQEDDSKDLYNRGKEALNISIEDIRAGYFRSFDSDTPDTENNKIHFKNFLRVEVSEDIKDIYCHAAEMGIDKSYMFAFTCSPVTSLRIIEANNLVKDTLDFDATSLQKDFTWWDKKSIAALDKYSYTNGKQYYRYFWYDSLNRRAYFIDFDM